MAILGPVVGSAGGDVAGPFPVISRPRLNGLGTVVVGENVISSLSSNSNYALLCSAVRLFQWLHRGLFAFFSPDFNDLCRRAVFL